MSPDPKSVPPDALVATLAEFEARLLKYAFSICRDVELAEDAVQDTFLRLAGLYHRLDSRELGRWLFTVCRNRSVDLARAGRRIVALDAAAYAAAPDEGPGPDAAAEMRDETALMLTALDELPELQREVIRLRYFGELAYVEIARATQQTTGTVGWLLHDALKTLRHKLSPAAV